MSTRFATRIDSGAGSYAYPNRSSLEITRDILQRQADPIGVSAGRAHFGSVEVSRRLVVKGTLYADAGPDRALSTRQLIEEFQFAHRALSPDRNRNEAAWHELYLTEDTASADNTRVARVTVRSVVIGEIRKPLTATAFVVEMETADSPFFVCPVARTSVLAVAGVPSVATSAGLAFTEPRIEVAVTRSAAGTLTIVNDANSQQFVLTPSVAGLYRIDTAAQTVERQVGLVWVDAIGEMGGEFLEMEPGANTFRLIGSGGVSASGADISWKDRF